jgi:hypothetical protein
MVVMTTAKRLPHCRLQPVDVPECGLAPNHRRGITATMPLPGAALTRARDGMARLIAAAATGDKLPAEHLLAEQLGVARGTLRAALVEFEAQPALAVVQGRRLVLPPPPAGSGPCHLVFVARHHPNEPIGSMDAVSSALLAGAAQRRIRCAVMSTAILDRLDPQAATAYRSVVVLPGLADQPAMRQWLAQLGSTPTIVCTDDPACPGVRRVIDDHHAGGRMCVEELIRRGCRRIGLMADGNLTPSWMQQRIDGMASACAAAGLPPLAIVRPPLTNRPGDNQEMMTAAVRLYVGHLAEHLLCEHPLDGLAMLTDLQVFICAAACRILHREPGRDVTLAGYDQYWRSCPERRLVDIEPAFSISHGDDGIVTAILDHIDGSSLRHTTSVKPHLS